MGDVRILQCSSKNNVTNASIKEIQTGRAKLSEHSTLQWRDMLGEARTCTNSYEAVVVPHTSGIFQLHAYLQRFFGFN